MDKQIYYKIYTWMTRELLDNMTNTDLVLEIDAYHWVSIFRRSDGDIDVSHYKDKDCEHDQDWGWVIDMEDERTVDDMHIEIDTVDVDSIQEYIRDKADFAYDLVFTW